MHGKKLLLDALKGETTPRPAWVPFVGVHGGKLIGVSATEYLQSADNIVAGLNKARELYQPDGLPVVFDLQMEAEVLGCDLHWAEQTPPSVVTHPLKSPDPGELPAFDLNKGRYPLVFDALRKLKADMGEKVALYGLVTGPFTLALHLRGDEIFLDMFDNEEGIKKLLAYTAEIGRQAAAAYLENGADVIAVVDPMTSQIGPEHFTQFVADPVNALFDSIRERGALSSLFVCGDATRNLELMCRTTCDNVSVDENIDFANLRDLALGNGKSFGGNLKLTTALLLGNENDCRRDALRCLDIGGNAGFVLAPGCDLPYDVPPENLQTVTELVRDEYQRDVARSALTVSEEDKFEDIELPDYASSPEIIVDVVTLNSASCAPCQYMYIAANNAAMESDSPVSVREHRITERDGLAYMTKLGVTAIPTICIQGKPSFASIIPDRRTLVHAIRTAKTSL